MLGKVSEPNGGNDTSKIVKQLDRINIQQKSTTLELNCWAQQDIKDAVKVIHPNGIIDTFNVLAMKVNGVIAANTLTVTAEDGIYHIITSVQGLITDIYYKVSPNTSVPDAPNITSLVKDDSNTVHITGTCQPSCILNLIFDYNPDPAAYFVVDETGKFELSIPFLFDFSSYSLAVQDGVLRSRNTRLKVKGDT
ncbi:hypothetical protein [Acinetobacter pollinis]|uniref:hypothetical protein n=1 Tax=Acinetobacter pollinis TaxID=2605270 RepID=UPI0018A2C582|nr:hypothetical protein [Acinetobacter pollinis]MBF7689579.1 hypothetical protein [Acinetobacter pollinis]MBF7698198.1 hypothetical protein [Acinetobacter pollinis]